jgi:hypothetical protein
MKQSVLIWTGAAITATGLIGIGYKLLKKDKKKKFFTEKTDTNEGGQDQPGVKTTKKKIARPEFEKKELVDKRNFINKLFDELIENGSMDPEDLNQPNERVPSIIFRQVYDWEQKRDKLDILFEIPKGSYLKGIRVFVEESGEEKEYPLPGKNMNAGQFIKFLSREYLTNLVKDTLPLYKDKVFVRLDGYYYVSYTKVDPENGEEDYGYKIIPVNMRRLKGSSDTDSRSLSNHLFKVFDAIVNEKREFIEDQFLVSKKNDQFRDKDIDDVLFAVRLSLFIADDEHPFGITPTGASNLIDELLQIVIPGRNTFSYENMIFFDPDYEEKEELMIYARKEQGNLSKLVPYPYNVDDED